MADTVIKAPAMNISEHSGSHCEYSYTAKLSKAFPETDFRGLFP